MKGNVTTNSKINSKNIVVPYPNVILIVIFMKYLVSEAVLKVFYFLCVCSLPPHNRLELSSTYCYR